MMGKDGLSLAAAALAAPLAATFCWLTIDDIAIERAFSSPIPYALIAFSWFVATPIYAYLQSWVRLRLWPVLLLSTLGACPFAAGAALYFLTPRDFFAVSVIFSTAWAGALTFWAVLRVFSTARAGRGSRDG